MQIKIEVGSSDPEFRAVLEALLSFSRSQEKAQLPASSTCTNCASSPPPTASTTSPTAPTVPPAPPASTAPPTAPTVPPAPPTEDVTPSTYDDARSALSDVLSLSRDEVVSILGRFGFARLTECPPEKYGLIVAACRKFLDG